MPGFDVRSPRQLSRDTLTQIHDSILSQWYQGLGHLLDGGVIQSQDGASGRPDGAIQEEGDLPRTPNRIRIGGAGVLGARGALRGVGSLTDDSGWIGRGIRTRGAGGGEPPELKGIPVDIQVGGDDDGYVLPNSLHLLEVPEGEGIIVPVGEDHPVGLCAHEEVVRPVPCGVVACPAGPGPVQHQGNGRDEQYGSGLPITFHQLPGQLPPQDCDSHSGPQAPHRKADDEEVVPLPDLVSGEISQGIQNGIPVLEVQVENQPDGERYEEAEKIPPTHPVFSEVLQGSIDSQPREEEGEGQSSDGENDLGSLEHPGPLPVEILEVIGELEMQRRQPGPDGRLDVLLPAQGIREIFAPSLAPGENAGQGSRECVAGGRSLVDDGTQPCPERQVEVNGEAQESGDHRRQVEFPVEEGPGVNQEYEEAKGRGREKGHEVVPHRQGQNEHHENEEVVVLSPSQILSPVEGEPGE